MADKQERPGVVIARWWHTNIGDREEVRSGRAKALAARLRRAEKIEALVEPEVFLLAKALRAKPADADMKPADADVERLYRIVKIMAHLRSDEDKTLAQKLGAAKKPEKNSPPVLSPLRFQRLMRAEGDVLTTALVRALSMADGACNVERLGGDLFYWSDRTRTRWIFDYHGAKMPKKFEENSQ